MNLFYDNKTDIVVCYIVYVVQCDTSMLETQSVYAKILGPHSIGSTNTMQYYKSTKICNHLYAITAKQQKKEKWFINRHVQVPIYIYIWLYLKKFVY